MPYSSSSTGGRILGIDPGLRCTGWGIIDFVRDEPVYVAAGQVMAGCQLPLPERLRLLYEGLEKIILDYSPNEVAVEQTFVNCNPRSSLKLGLACGMALLAPSRAGVVAIEYSANLVKQAVSGSGHAGKRQIQDMIHLLLPGLPAGAVKASDAADALAVALCHLRYRHVGTRYGTHR